VKFLVFYEKAANNYCAFVPNLPVICLSTGATVEEIRRSIREAMEGHIEFMMEDGEYVVEPSVWYENLEIRLQEDGAPLKYSVIFENSPTNNAAYCPDIPGCWVSGGPSEEVREGLRQLIRFRMGGAAPDDAILPEPDSWGEFVDVVVPAPTEGIPTTGN
jgi:predicted RNase H-like HicB family nuclease